MKFEGFRSSMEFKDGMLKVYRKNFGTQDINITIPLAQITTVGMIKPSLGGKSNPLIALFLMIPHNHTQLSSICI